MERTIILIIAGLVLIETILEAVLPDKNKITGEVSHENVYKGLITSSIFILICAVAEFIILRKRINISVTVIGVILIGLKIALKIWVLKTLGGYWSLQIETRKKQKLVTGGPYRFMRHPSYLSTTIEAVAFMLILNSYISIALFFIVYFPLLLKRIYLEEEVLITLFGEKYLDYKNTVSALFPIKSLRSDDENA